MRTFVQILAAAAALSATAHAGHGVVCEHLSFPSAGYQVNFQKDTRTGWLALVDINAASRGGYRLDRYTSCTPYPNSKNFLVSCAGKFSGVVRGTAELYRDSNDRYYAKLALHGAEVPQGDLVRCKAY